MPQLRFARHLQRIFPDLKDGPFEGKTMAEVIAAVNHHYPGLADYIIDERGVLRQHVNIFRSKNCPRPKAFGRSSQ